MSRTSWATEIHAALNESTLTASTVDVLRRIGQRLGAEGGTSADDDPLLRIEHERSRQQRGLEMLTESLAARGIATSKRLAASGGVIATLPDRVLMRAALACRNEDDFLRRLETAASRSRP